MAFDENLAERRKKVVEEIRLKLNISEVMVVVPLVREVNLVIRFFLSSFSPRQRRFLEISGIFRVHPFQSRLFPHDS